MNSRDNTSDDEHHHLDTFASLTDLVIQVGWKTPTEFLCCPNMVGPNALQDYMDGLEFGTVFSENHYGSSVVVDVRYSDNKLVVLTRFTDNIKDWGVTYVWVANERFYHRSEGTFFALAGAVKRLAVLSGEEHDLGDTIDDFC